MTVGRVLLEVQRIEVDGLAGRVRAAGDELRRPGAELAEVLTAASGAAAGTVGVHLDCAEALAACARVLAEGFDGVTAGSGHVADGMRLAAATLEATDDEVARGLAGGR